MASGAPQASPDANSVPTGIDPGTSAAVRLVLHNACFINVLSTLVIPFFYCRMYARLGFYMGYIWPSFRLDSLRGDVFLSMSSSVPSKGLQNMALIRTLTVNAPVSAYDGSAQGVFINGRLISCLRPLSLTDHVAETTLRLLA